MDHYIGKMLDNRYEILECIGNGGMAVVYKARCHRLNRLVAIKILKPELASDEEFLRRFHVESQAVAMLSHANIVSIYDVCHSDGLDYIVMELIDGMTLKQYMTKRGVPLNWREALHFITQVVSALGHAHSRGIIHRDIKPHNIMVLRDGSVKVADFGIARLNSAVQSTLTQEALGSVHYISPEQAKGSHIDGRSDLYSVGVMLYEMLTGRLPFEGESPVQIAIQHINSIPIPPREINPEIPQALEAITMKAMAPNPEHRYASAEAMLEDLREFRKNPGMELTHSQTKQEVVDEPTVVMRTDEVKAAMGREVSAARPVNSQAAHSRTRQESQTSGKRNYEDDEYRPRRSPAPAIVSILLVLVLVALAGVFVYRTLIKDLMKPAEEYTVPDLRGYTLEDLAAEPSLLNGFTYVVGLSINNTEYAEGEICRQDPGANTVVRTQDTVITVSISAGEDSVYMPDVTNWECRTALHTLQNEYGLYVKQERVTSDTVTKDYIVSFTPIEGTLLKKGDTVTIVISSGPEESPINVPPFTNVNIEQAKSQAESLGLKVGKTEYFYNDEYAEDRVIWQSLTALQAVDPGTVIDFQVSKGPEPKPELPPEPSGEPSTPPSGDPEPSTSVDLPSVLPTGTKVINVDLSTYSDEVSVRIMVGGTVFFDSRVDCNMNTSLSREVSGTGIQQVLIFIDGELVQSYDLEF